MFTLFHHFTQIPNKISLNTFYFIDILVQQEISAATLFCCFAPFVVFFWGGGDLNFADLSIILTIFNEIINFAVN